MHSLPVFLRLRDRPVILLGSGTAAAAKRRLLERAGARIVDEADAAARLAIVAGDEAAARRLRARGVLVNLVDRPDLCDFTLPAIVDRDPVLVAVGTGGASAGLAKALRQRLERLLPAGLGRIAERLREVRAMLHERWPDPDERRRAIDAALAPGGPLDPLGDAVDTSRGWPDGAGSLPSEGCVAIRLRSADPDDLTLREARLLAAADRIHAIGTVPPAILARARADAELVSGAPAATAPARSGAILLFAPPAAFILPPDRE